MRRDGGPAIEIQPRLALIPQRWPIKVFPVRDELLSSWLHRLAHAHGVSPRHFGERLGVGSGAWSARLDLDLPERFLNHLRDQTGVDRDEIKGMAVGAEPWRPLLLPLRWSKGKRGGATWLQFCPLCLAEDETPYFRRRWRRASVLTCRRHGRALLDRCGACGEGLAPFEQLALLPQHHCVRCGFDLRDARSPSLTRTTRRSAELLDDLVRLEAAKGVLGKSALMRIVLTLPSLEERPRRDNFARLSTAERIRCVARLEERLMRRLGDDPDPAIAAWRKEIIAEGGVAPTLESLPRLLKTGPKDAGGKPRRGAGEVGAVRLHGLLSAYVAVNQRRERESEACRRGGGFESSDDARSDAPGAIALAPGELAQAERRGHVLGGARGNV